MTETKLRAERGEKGDGKSREEIEEDDGKDGGSELELEHGSTKGPERERGCGGVGGKPHPHTVRQALNVVPLIGEDSFDSTGLDSI